MCDRPVGVVQQTGINLDGESVVCRLSHVHQWLKVLNNRRILEERRKKIQGAKTEMAKT